jgi:SAM-dependent methyltransferase
VAQAQGAVAPVDPRTAENRFQWQRKPVLRAIYGDLYRRMAAHCAPGRTLEIGGGSGNFKEYATDVLASDIAFAPWLDLVADAQSLPVAARSLGNIVMFDVLHHLEFPRAFFAEAARVLRPGGRIVMVEPAITLASWPFYRFVHPEPVRMGEDPLREGRPSAGRDPFDANQAFPTLLATRHRQRFAALFPRLEFIRVDWLSLFAYPLSGGFRPWSAIPAGMVADVLRLESVLAPWLGRIMGFRLLLVIEVKSSPSSPASRHAL